MTHSLDLAAWTTEAVDDQCRDAYNRYSRELDAHYAAYYAARPDERGSHVRQASDLARALPPGWDRLSDRLPERVRHRHHLSGRSSQVLALAVLGASEALDFSLDWLFAALAPLPPTDSPLETAFEHELSPDALNEQKGRVTSIDYLARTSKLAVCVEAKRGESGLGSCSCPPGAAAIADCSEKVLARPAYWRVAYDLFGLPDREPGKHCPISLGYQAVRSVAAARHLATGGRAPVFALIYDAENPYFRRCGSWPGWPAVLDHTLGGRPGQIRFRAVSWQELIPRLPVDDDFRDWMRVKHRLI